jgi:hypothetical protein
LADKQTDAVVQFALCIRFFSDNGQTLDHVNQKILEVGGVFLFAAYAGDGAAGPFGRFLALKTEHAHVILSLVGKSMLISLAQLCHRVQTKKLTCVKDRQKLAWFAKVVWQKSLVTVRL